jgi:hypothetical protein
VHKFLKQRERGFEMKNIILSLVLVMSVETAACSVVNETDRSPVCLKGALYDELLACMRKGPMSFAARQKAILEFNAIERCPVNVTGSMRIEKRGKEDFAIIIEGSNGHSAFKFDISGKDFSQVSALADKVIAKVQPSSEDTAVVDPAKTLAELSSEKVE